MLKKLSKKKNKEKTLIVKIKTDKNDLKDLMSLYLCVF